MAEFHEAIALIRKARELIQRAGAPGYAPSEDERLGFLAESESFLADGCGVRVNYFERPRLTAITKQSSGSRWYAWYGTEDGRISMFPVGGYVTEQEALAALKAKEEKERGA